MTHGLLQLDPPNALERLKQESTWLIDVRERSEVAQAAYDAPNVVVMPLSEFERRHFELPRNGELIMACAHGRRSMQAMMYLQHHGHTKVSNLAGGMAAWRMHGLPVRLG